MGIGKHYKSGLPWSGSQEMFCLGHVADPEKNLLLRPPKCLCSREDLQKRWVVTGPHHSAQKLLRLLEPTVERTNKVLRDILA